MWWEPVGGTLDSGADKKLFEVKRKDQMNALKNLIELNDVNQQYKIIDIMLKGLFKVSHSMGHLPGSVCCGATEGGQEKQGGPEGLHRIKEKSWASGWDLRPEGRMLWGFKAGWLGQHPWGTGKVWQDGAVTEGSGRCWRTPGLCSSLPTCLLTGLSLRTRR